MPLQQVGRFILTGTAQQNAKIVAAINECNVDLAKLLKKDILVRFKDIMPLRSDGGMSWAFYRTRLTPRRILMWTEFAKYPVKKSFLHEIGHAIADDVMTRPKRIDAMAMMKPKPDGWGDTKIGGVDKGYRALPSECFADSFMEAVSRFESRLDGWYLRDIKDSELDKLRAIILRADPSVPEPPEPEPVPTPPIVDESEALRDRIGELEAKIEAARGTLTL